MSQKKIDPRVLRTRKLLQDALVSLIPEKGFEAITVQDITERATLNRATFYLHYVDKLTLLNAAIYEVTKELETIPISVLGIESAMNETPPVFIHLFEHVAKHRHFYEVMLKDESVAVFASQMELAIQQIGLSWLSQAQINWKRLPIPAEIFLSYLASAYLGMVKWWLANDMPYNAEYMAKIFMELTLMGIHRTLKIPTDG